MDAKSRIDQIRYRCSRCSELHSGLPELSFGLPNYIDAVPAIEREKRCKISDDLCVLDGKHHFVRGILHLPIKDTSEVYGIGIWTSLSAANFAIYIDDFHGERTGKCGPFFGWLSNAVPTFENPFEQKCLVHVSSGSARPTLELEPTEHPLAVAQRDGLSLDAALQIAEQFPGIKFLVVN